MKKIITFALCAALLLTLAACGKKTEEAPAETTAAPTTEATTAPTEPAPTEPEWEPATVRAGDLGVLYKLFQRGDSVTVLGTIKDYFVIEGEDANLLIEARFLRPEGEEAPEEKEAYSRANTEVFATAYLNGEPIAVLKQNTKIQVLDAKANWAYISWDEGTGYVDAQQISPWFIRGGTGGTGGGTGGGGGYQPQDGTDVNIGSLSAVQESSYELVKLGAYHGPVYEEFAAPKEGLILSADTEAYLTLMVRGNEAKVTEVGEETCSVLVGDLIGTVPTWALAMEGHPEYEAWSAYAKNNAVAYEEYQQKNELKKFKTNDRVQVVDELEELELYVVEIDGIFGYMKMDSLSKTELKYYAGGGNAGGGTGGGTGGSNGWTPPMM